MKQKLTFLLTVLLLLTGMTSWGQTRAEVVAYTLDGTITGGSNGYATESEITQNNLTWMVMGNTTMNPWRIGGKSLTNENRTVYSTGTLSDNITKVVVTHGTANDVTVNSMTLIVSANSDFSNPTSTLTGDFAANSATTFTKPSTVDWTGMYFKITYNLTITATSNKFLQFISASFYKEEGGGQQETVATPTFSPAEGSYFEPQQVTISCATEGATICYTTDGTDPNENSAQFTPGVPLNISETTTVKAKAYKSGYTPSNVASATYTFPTLMTIAEAKALSVNEYALVQGIVTFIENRNVYVQDNTGGICLYLNSNTVPSTLALGDMVQGYGKRANYNGLYELSNINGGNANEFSIISSGNTLPLAVKTIAQVIEGGADALQCTRVKIEGATIGAINTSGNTPLTQGENSTNIYKVPALTDINEGDVVDVIGVVGYFNAPQIRVALASDVTLNYVPNPQLTLTPTELSGFQYTFGEGPSQSLSFAVTGSDLTVNVSIAAPQDFEVATTAEGPFADNLSLTPVEGLVDANVYVRMKSGLAIGSYAGNVTVTTGTLNATVALSGTVLEDQSPVLNANPTSLSGFTYDFEDGGPSEVASFLLGGDNLTNNVAVYPSESFEVSTNVNFRPENPAMVYIPYSGHFYDISIYVRMKAGLEGGTYNEQIYAVSEGADTLFINVSGTVTGGTPTPPEPPTPGDGNYVRISDLNSLTDGAYVIVAARFDDNAADYYAMTAATTGKPTGVLFTSATSGTDEVLPASIVDEEETYYWVVGVTDNGYTFTNAAGDLIGYTSSTNFATGGDNTEWAITIQTSEEGAMVPNYTGFVINNVNNDVRAFALNSSHNFGPYHTQNMGGSGYNFFLDLFVKTEGGEPPVPTVATPTFTPEGGTYFEEQSVSIVCATDGATIHYSTVSENGPWTTYNGAITVDESMTIWAYATKEGYNDSPVASATYTIQSGVVTIFNQDWEGEMNGWTFVSVNGEMEWTVATHQGNHYAYANGYSSGAAHANEDWCISPAFNLNAYSNPVLTFSTAKNYTGPDIEVFFSNNYNGTNPSAATWQPLTCALSTGSWTWVESGEIDLSSFSGTECYIGFKYTSTDSEAAGWEVDDILLVGQTSEAVVTVTPLALTGFTYVEGNGPSAEQSFTVSGLNLNSNVVIAEAADYEISLLSGDDFTAQSSLTLSHDNGTIDGAVIYVRLKAGLAVGEYNDEDITITCADVDDIEVTCSGNVTAEPVPGDDYVRISDVSALVAGNRVILAARYNETADAYLAIANTPTSGKLTTTEFTSEMNGSDEIIPASILGDEDSYYWTVDVTDDGYTFTNANGDMIGYGNSGTNLVLNGEKTVWTITTGVSAPESLVPEYFGFNIINATTDTRAMALRVTDTESIVKAYATSNMTNGEYNFFLDIFMQGEGGVPPTPTVAAPVFTPGAGTYYETQDVTITCATADATIYYSLDSENGPWEEYEEAITVDESMTLWAYAEKEGYNDSPVVSTEYVIQNDLVIIFNQDWEEDWHGWTQVNVEGEDAEWTIAEHSGNHYAYMNGYNHGANEDWLISPAFDLDSYSDVVLTFITAMNYTGPAIEVLFSNDYDGTDPNAANWEPLTCELSPGSWTWTESGDISLDEFNGNNCYIAFKYICDENEAAAWEVDNILLVSGSVGANPTLTATPNTINGLDYIEGEGPSNSQSYTLTGSNLVGEGDVTLTASENFEISLDDEDFFTTLYVQYADGELIDQPVTIYVRLVEGLDVDTYTGTISHEGGEATTEVNVTGTVHSEDEPAMIAMMPYYIQGNNGSNNNRVPVAMAAYLYNLAPETTYRYVNQFVDSNDGPETAGAGNVIYANVEGFYRSTSPSLSTEGGYGEFTTDEDGIALVWFINEPTANARFTPGNEVYLRVRINDGNDGTTVENIFTSYDYATVLNFGTERDAYQGTAFYAKSNEPAMTFAMLHADAEDERPIYSTSIETTGVDYAGINQYADFYKELVAGKDGWFGGILPNNNKDGINTIMIVDMESNVINTYHTENGQWHPNANTSNPSAGLDEPIFIDLTDDGVDDNVEANVTVLSANHEFVIENGDNAHYMMTVYNVLGQPVMQKQINAGSTERISHNLATGIYVIRMENNQSRVSVKVLVM
jgi:hypothetical protein